MRTAHQKGCPPPKWGMPGPPHTCCTFGLPCISSDQRSAFLPAELSPHAGQHHLAPGLQEWGSDHLSPGSFGSPSGDAGLLTSIKTK